MMQDEWKATGWLGIVTAGALWTPFFEQDKFDVNLRSLVQQIQRHVADPEAPTDEEGYDDDEEEAFTVLDRAKELKRLEEDLTGEVKPDGVKGFALPAGVPELPAALMVTVSIAPTLPAALPLMIRFSG
jgi:hypothetical protein